MMITNNQPSDAELQQLLKKSDEAAFGVLVRRYTPLVERAATANQLTPSEIPDVMQATFLVLWNQRQSLPAASKLGGWLYGVARNLSRQQIRSAARGREREANWHLNENMKNQESTQIEDAALSVTLHRSLETLNVQQRQLVVSRFWHKKPFSEIGKDVGCSEGAAKKRLATVLSKLRSRIGGRKGTAMTSVALLTLLESEGAIAPVYSVSAEQLLGPVSDNVLSLAKSGGGGESISSPATFMKIAAACLLGGALYFGIQAVTKSEAIEPEESKRAGAVPASGGVERVKGQQVEKQPSITEWTLSPPTVMLEIGKDTPGKRGVWHWPGQVFFLNGKAVIPVTNGMKTRDGKLDLFMEGEEGWKKISSIEKLGFPVMHPLGDGTLGIVGHSTENGNASSAYGNSLLFYRFDPETGISKPFELATPPNGMDRLTMAGLVMQESGELVAVVHMRDREKQKSYFFETRSLDHGETWSDLVQGMDTPLPKYSPLMPGVSLGEEGVGVISFDKHETALMVVPPGGGEWNSRPVELSDDLPVDLVRVPVNIVTTGSKVHLAYLAIGEDRGGFYYLTSSKDGGINWSPGRKISETKKVDDFSQVFSLTSHGDKMIASQVHSNGTWGQIGRQQSVSGDGGNSWYSLSETDESVALGQATIDPSRSRAIVTEVVNTSDGGERVQVRQFAPSQ